MHSNKTLCCTAKNIGRSLASSQTGTDLIVVGQSDEARPKNPADYRPEHRCLEMTLAGCRCRMMKYIPLLASVSSMNFPLASNSCLDHSKQSIYSSFCNSAFDLWSLECPRWLEKTKPLNMLDQDWLKRLYIFFSASYLCILLVDQLALASLYGQYQDGTSHATMFGLAKYL